MKRFLVLLVAVGFLGVMLGMHAHIHKPTDDLVMTNSCCYCFANATLGVEASIPEITSPDSEAVFTVAIESYERTFAVRVLEFSPNHSPPSIQI